MAVVRYGNCPGWQLSGMAVVRDGSCPVWQLSVWQLSVWQLSVWQLSVHDTDPVFRDTIIIIIFLAII